MLTRENTRYIIDSTVHMSSKDMITLYKV